MKKTLLASLAMGIFTWAAICLFPKRGLAGVQSFHSCFDDEYFAGRRIPLLVDSALSSPFAPIDGCRPDVSGKMDIISRDISSFTCPPPDRISCCGPALGFQDGGGQYVTFRYSIPGTISTGSYVSYQVVAYGSDGGGLLKYVSTDGINFTQVGTNSDAFGTHQIPLPTGTSQVYFRLKTDPATGIFGGIIVDNVDAVLFDTPQSPVSIQEGGGTYCVFNASPFCASVPNLCQRACPANGDINGDALLTPADVVLMLNCTFLGTPGCLCTAP